MGNKVTNTLPAGIDNRLQDIAQMHGGIDYTDMNKFGKKASKADLKIVRSLINQMEDEEGENENTIKTIVAFVRVVIGKEHPIQIVRYAEVIDNWGREEASKKASVIKKVLTSPKDFNDDMRFEELSGSHDIDSLEGKIVQVGKEIFPVPYYEEA